MSRAISPDFINKVNQQDGEEHDMMSPKTSLSPIKKPEMIQASSNASLQLPEQMRSKRRGSQHHFTYSISSSKVGAKNGANDS